MDELKKSQNGL